MAILTARLVVWSRATAECYELERGRYIGYERWLSGDVPQWGALPLFFRASMLDFVHNKGGSAFRSSTMKRKLLAGDLEGACLENLRWNRGTVKGVSTVLPGLDVRGKSNSEICMWDAPPAPPRPPVVALTMPEVLAEPPAPVPAPPPPRPPVVALTMPEVLAEPPAPVPAPPPPPRQWWQRMFGSAA